MSDDPSDSTAYDLAPGPTPTSRAAVRRPVPAGLAVPVAPATEPRQPTLDYQRPAAGQAGRAAPAEPETIKNLHAPLWLLGGGVAVGIIAAFVRNRSLPDALTYVALDLVIGTLLMLVGLLLAARARAIDLGGFWPAVLKLAAISVAPAAAADLLAPLFAFIPLGGLVLLVVQFVVYFALIGALFDLDQSDTWYCVCVIFLVRLAVYFTLMYAL